MADEPTTDEDQSRRITVLTAAVGELTARIAELEGEEAATPLVKRVHERGLVQRVRRGDGRVVQRVTRG